VPRTIRVLRVVDAYTRECLALEVDTSFGSRRATRVLEAIIAERGVPQAIRCDNGPESTSRHFLAWCIERQIGLVHVQPGKLTQNVKCRSRTDRNVSSRLIFGFSGDEVRSRGRRLSPLLWQPCTSFPHAVISAAFLANSAGGK
jgi:transposase InsO family protein